MSAAPSKLPHKIELTKTYPCPCCPPGQGELRLITLTEALGCNRCQKIFSLTPDQIHIEQLGITYHQRHQWFWDGSRWTAKQEESLPWSILVISSLVILLICLIVIFVIAQIVDWFRRRGS